MPVSPRAVLVAMVLAALAGGCGAAEPVASPIPSTPDVPDVPDTPVPDTPAPETPAPRTTVPEQDVAAPPVPVTPAPTLVPGHGTEIGFGRVGGVIALPQPWPVGTVYLDLEPGVLIVDFTPPDPACIVGQATAEIGRGGAILVSLWIEGAPPADGCPGGADTNQIRIPLAEPLGERRVYTSTSPATGGATDRAELLADAVVGMDADEAVALIEREGFEVRDVTGADAVESDFRADRIDIWRAGDVIEFAAVS